STVDDLYKWDRALYGEKLLNNATRQKMFTEHVEGVGYGWFIRKGKRRLVASSGRSPGFSANLDRFLDDDVCVIVLSNLYTSITQSMAPDLAAIFFGEERKPLIPPAPVSVSKTLLDTYAGRYQFGEDFVFNPRMVAEVKREGDGLVLISGGGGGTSYLIAQAENRFLDRLYGGIVTFSSGENGKIARMNWNFGRDYKANRID
ncbi:MAG: hypothetical protein HYR58_03845, partial [Acidobacteria bacterium]|nr:hypothetical protein [Acidobacteriota bacterium]